MSIKLYHDDCFNVFPLLEEKSIDLVLCDMPYGTTACKWDTVIDLERMWKEIKRIVKPNAAIVLTASQPFTTILINSNFKFFKYSLVWDKKFAGNFVQAKRRPLATHEDILIFCFENNLPKYNPQKIKRDRLIYKGGNKQSQAIPIARTNKSIEFSSIEKVYNDKNPISILEFNSRADRISNKSLHPTQKPVALMEYLIKTYSNEGDVVLDFCMGSGTTGVACKNLNRSFIGIEKEENYFNIAKERLK